MTAVVLDSGGVTGLVGDPARLRAIGQRDLLPAQVPSAVLTEVLTGDHRRDFHVNRVLKLCQIRDITEPIARTAARLRTLTGRSGTIAVTDALVVALASAYPVALILTSNPADITLLAANAVGDIRLAVI